MDFGRTEARRAVEVDARRIVAKKHAPHVADWDANDALKPNDGYGCLKDFPADCHMRDLGVRRILKCTNEIMRVTVPREMFRR